MDELILPSFPIISSLLLFSPFNHSTHHLVFGTFHRIKLIASLVECLPVAYVCCRMLGSPGPLVLAVEKTFDWFSKHFHIFEE